MKADDNEKAFNLLLNYISVAFVYDADVDKSPNQKPVEFEYCHLLEAPYSGRNYK
jgi:hypothetical protein